MALKIAESSSMPHNLHLVAQHNAGVTSGYSQGLGITLVSVASQTSSAKTDNQQDSALDDEEALYSDNSPFEYADTRLLTAPTPRSSTPSDGRRRTRSGRTVKRNDSPLNSIRDTSSRVSKSPRAKKVKAGKSDKSKTARIPGPLSLLTVDSAVPVKNMEAWVNRSSEDRVRESEMRKGHIARPMNSFMLYRSAYADRTKDWCKQNNHQVVSSVAGESWPLEPEEVREQFGTWAQIERANHAKAFPNYKFSPSKANSLKRKEEKEDMESTASFDDPDADYAPSRRTPKRARIEYEQQNTLTSSPYVPEAYMYVSNSGPYQQAQWQGQYQAPWQVNTIARPLPGAHHQMDPYAQQWQPVPSNAYQYGAQYEAPQPMYHQQPQFQQPRFQQDVQYMHQERLQYGQVQQAPAEVQFTDALPNVAFDDEWDFNLDPSLKDPETEYGRLMDREHLA